MLERIGRLVIVVYNDVWFGRMIWQYGKVKNEKIYWIENKTNNS